MRIALPARIKRPSGLEQPSRRRWLLYVTAGLATVAVFPTIRRIRRRRPGEPGPTGWFGHC
jgi:hypothetical protein